LPTKILLLTLRTFSATGGIEKVSRVVGKALTEMDSHSLQTYSLHDSTKDLDEKYFSKKIFKGFKGSRLGFIVSAWRKGVKSDVVILTHINLIPVARLIQIFSPKTKLIVIAHGIEVWAPLLRGFKKKLLQKVDQIIAVSHHTKNRLLQENKISEDKITVINNCLDPYLPKPIDGEKDEELLVKYGLRKEDKVLMTLTRLSLSEKNKGYDRVMQAMQQLSPTYPHLKYLLMGKCDAEEKFRIEQLIKEFHLEGKVILTGFIGEEDLAAHYNLADIYIMPSEKEGFGITFIEAMYYHKPVIAGNTDGSVDALLNGQLGTLINPQSVEEMMEAIKKIINNKFSFMPNRELLEKNFGYNTYAKKWKNFLNQTVEVS
jgi:glycosyltransferase involved in cell wall biosynthesis